MSERPRPLKAYYNLQHVDVRNKSLDELAERFWEYSIICGNETIDPESIMRIKRAVPHAKLLAMEGMVSFVARAFRSNPLFRLKSHIIPEEELYPFHFWQTPRGDPIPFYVITPRIAEQLVAYTSWYIYGRGGWDGRYLDVFWDRFPVFRLPVLEDAGYSPEEIRIVERDWIDGRRLYVSSLRARHPEKMIIANVGPASSVCIDPGLDGFSYEGIGRRYTQERVLITSRQQARFAIRPGQFIGWITQAECRVPVERLAELLPDFHIGESALWPW